MSAGPRRFALVIYESRRRVRESLALAVGISVLGLLMVAFFPSVRESGADLQAYVDNLPPAFRAAFGIEAFTTMGGFLAAELYQFGWVLLLGLYFAYRGGSLVAGPVETGRMDTLLATPLSRTGVVLQVSASLLVPAVAVNVVAFGAVAGGVYALGESVAIVPLVMVHALSLPYLLSTAALGLLLSVSLGSSDLAQRAALGLVVALFLVETVAVSVGSLTNLALVSPTHYYDPTAILVRSEYDLGGAAVLLAATGALVAVSVLRFRRVDVG